MRKIILAIVFCMVLCGCETKTFDTSDRNFEIPRQEVTVSLVAVGDNLIHSSVYNDAARLASGQEGKE